VKRLLIGLVCGLVLAATAHAGVIGYWRAEVDNDAGGGLSIPNEVAGTPLTAPNATIAPDVPLTPIPWTGAINVGSINGNANIDGTVAYYAALDAASVTIEYFARTNEGDARLLLRQSGTTGLRIDQPNNVRVQYSTSAGQVTLSNQHNYGSTWDHFAFTYDAATGIGKAFVNGLQVGINDGPDGLPLTWPAGASLLVGQALDGGTGFSNNSLGFFDELRISDVALEPSQFLIAPGIPEPGTLSLLALGALGLLRRRRGR